MDSIEGVPEILPTSLKNLGDKSFDRRKAAAQEISAVVSALDKDGNTEKIKKILLKLSMECLKSPIVYYRNGALVSIASIAIVLDTKIVDYFPLFLEPVLKCLEDADNKVRYYTSEALYNITKAASTGIIVCFDQFLYADFQLTANDDTDLKNISFFYSN